MDYEEALELYFQSEDVYVSPGLGEKLQPSLGASSRDDADTGWVFRNVNGWLATVHDDGTVVATLDALEQFEFWPDLLTEYQRGTAMDQGAYNDGAEAEERAS